jgi:hypothetical protein
MFNSHSCASHDFAVESLRRKKVGGKAIERNDRLCRLCGTISGAVEEVHHALFCCKGHLRLLSLRIEFFRNLPLVKRSLLPDDGDNDAWNGLIAVWADETASAIPFARLAWHVSRLFYEHPMLIPDIPSLTLGIPDPVFFDPASDYSSEEEVVVATGSGGSAQTWIPDTIYKSPVAAWCP